MAENLTFSNLFDRPSSTPLAVDRGHVITLEELGIRTQQWKTALKSHSGERWAVYHTDAFEFFAILLALWQLQRTASVPGDNLPGTVQRLASRVDGFVGDFPLPSTVKAKYEGAFFEVVNWGKLAAEFVALEIYTSGSTGEPKPILKTIAQLESEAEALEKQWPSQIGKMVLGTVSHQHLYGMTFRLFWPVLSQQVFECTTCEYTEDVFHRASRYDAFVVVSSPSHLGRMNTSVNWSSVAERCAAVFSSAAPLLRKDSLVAGQLLNAPVREIYGSSETGAIAWRCQQDTQVDAFWMPLPGNQLLFNPERQVSLLSPYLGDNEPFELADQLKFHEGGRFSLEGRLDSVVKVEGKRLSLLEMESHLQNINWVERAKALTITRSRVEIAVVIELSAMGAEELNRIGRQALIKCLKTKMANHFEAVLLPRRWRFVEQMPYNPQGKLPLQALHSLFEKEPRKWPRIESEEVTDHQVLMTCLIPEDLIYFNGHFESNPILPGIVQVHWAEAYGRRLMTIEGRFLRLEVVKFQQVIVPGSLVKLILKYDQIKQKLIFEYSSQRGVHSSGRICFG